VYAPSSSSFWIACAFAAVPTNQQSTQGGNTTNYSQKRFICLVLAKQEAAVNRSWKTHMTASYGERTIAVVAHYWWGQKLVPVVVTTFTTIWTRCIIELVADHSAHALWPTPTASSTLGSSSTNCSGCCWWIIHTTSTHKLFMLCKGGIIIIHSCGCQGRVPRMDLCRIVDIACETIIVHLPSRITQHQNGCSNYYTRTTKYYNTTKMGKNEFKSDCAKVSILWR
jgi:hypothetical protein